MIISTRCRQVQGVMEKAKWRKRKSNKNKSKRLVLLHWHCSHDKTPGKARLSLLLLLLYFFALITGMNNNITCKNEFPFHTLLPCTTTHSVIATDSPRVQRTSLFIFRLEAYHYFMFSVYFWTVSLNIVIIPSVRAGVSLFCFCFAVFFSSRFSHTKKHVWIFLPLSLFSNTSSSASTGK